MGTGACPGHRRRIGTPPTRRGLPQMQRSDSATASRQQGRRDGKLRSGGSRHSGIHTRLGPAGNRKAPPCCGLRIGSFHGSFEPTPSAARAASRNQKSGPLCIRLCWHFLRERHCTTVRTVRCDDESNATSRRKPPLRARSSEALSQTKGSNSLRGVVICVAPTPIPR